MPVDQLNQVVSVGDTVVYYNCLYKVKTVGSHYCTARLLGSNTTRKTYVSSILYQRNFFSSTGANGKCLTQDLTLEIT